MQLSSRLVSEGTKKADKKMGKIRRWRGGEGTDHRLGSIPILPDLLIFLFHPLPLGRPALRLRLASCQVAFAFAWAIASRALCSSGKMFAGADSFKLPSATVTPVKVGGMPYRYVPSNMA